MKKRWLVLILAVVAVIVAISVAALLFKDKGQNDILINEINSLSENNINMEIKSEGQYGIVEKMVKEDYKLYIDSIATLKGNYEELTTLKVINLDNYGVDGPEFKESLGKLNGMKEENATILASLSDMVDPNKIEERIIANGLEDRFAKMYRDILKDIEVEEWVKALKEKDVKYEGYADSLIAVLEYMKENKNEWFIENNTLKSKSQTFIDTYHELLEKTNVEI